MPRDNKPTRVDNRPVRDTPNERSRLIGRVTFEGPMPPPALAKTPRVHLHFVPTSSSWLNLVERFFGELTQRQLKRLAITSVDQLVAAITAYIENRNRNPKPFVWTATVQHILDKVGKAKRTLSALH